MNKEVAKYYKPSILKDACSQYEISHEKVSLIQGNANLIFDCGDKILRLSHSCIRTRNDIAPEIDWLLYLKENNLPVVEVLPSKRNEFIHQIGSAEDHFSCVCFRKVGGGAVLNEDWGEMHFMKLGKLVGTLHRTGQKYTEKENLIYKHWDEIIEFEAWKFLPKDNRNLEELHDLLIANFSSYPKTTSNYGLIHYDVHQGNYFLPQTNKEITLFDFEMACKSWYANDVAAALHYANHHPVSREKEDFDAFFLKSFWKGYEQEYTMKEEERRRIPQFVLYRNILVYGCLHKIFHADQRKSMEFLFDRYSHFIQKRRIELGM
jgi:Ser/Thr protein kinase RdoA (MazF antagonist)